VLSLKEALSERSATLRPEIRFIILLPLNIAVELAFLFLCKLLIFKKSMACVTPAALAAAGAIATSLTLPYVWFVLYWLVRDRTAYVVASEAFAVIVEGLLYCFILKLRLRIGLAVSLIANAASFLILYRVDALLLFLAAPAAGAGR
jgi:hypothetical protein